MSQGRRALKLLSILTFGFVGCAGTALGQQINLGPAADFAWDQPRASWVFARPGTDDVVGPGFDLGGGLLDTGANGIVLGQLAYFDEDFNFREDLYDIEQRTDGSLVQFKELGVAGFEFFDTLVPHDLVLSTDGVTEIRVSSVRGLGKPDLAVGPSAVIGMPAMVGRFVHMNIRSLGEESQITTSFLDAAPATTPRSYTVPLTRLVADPGAGQVEPGDPLPTYADLPLVSVRTGVADRSSTGASLVDTGAQLSMITTQTAAELGLNLDEASATSDIQGHIEVGGIGGSVDAPLVVIDRLVIPAADGTDLVLSGVVAGVVDIPGIGGIFGMNLFTGGQVPPILGEGQTGSLDGVLFDFTGSDWTMRLDVAPEYHAVGGKARTLEPAAGATVTWNKTSADWTADGSTPTTYQDNDFVRFGPRTGPTPVNVAEEVRPAWVTVDSPADYTLSGEPIAGTTGVSKRGTGTLRIENANTYSGRTDVREGKLVFAAPQNIGDVFVQPAGTVEFQTSQRLGALRIADGRAVVTPGGGKMLTVADFNASGTGTLDLMDNDMVIHVPLIVDPLDPDAGSNAAEVFEVVRELLLLARNAPEGRWKGPGVTSSAAADATTTALAIVWNDDGQGNPIYTTFNGEAVDEDSILIKYTYAGDANLDGIIDADDYFRIDSSFANQPVLPGWRDGDFNYDGLIDADDYFQIDSAFAGQGAALGQALRAVSVPEPGMGLLMTAAGVLFARRRR